MCLFSISTTKGQILFALPVYQVYNGKEKNNGMMS